MPVARRFGIVIAVLALFIVASIPFLSGMVGAYLDEQYYVGVCERTETVRDALVEASPVSECGEVTPLHLRDITELNLSDRSIASLSHGDLGGLHRLRTLDLSGNSLTSLPAGLFDDLFLLEELRLHDNRLTTLPADIFDRLFLLEEITLHDNAMEELPEGMFGDLSRFKGLLNGEEVSGMARIRQFLAEHEIASVEEFIEALPELHKERFVFVYDSAGLGAEFVSAEHPRVISWGADAEFVFAWQTNPDASDKFRNSVEFLLPEETRWTAGLIDFSSDSPEIRQPDACQSCHGELSKPLWSGMFWEGAEGGVGGSLSRNEMEDAMRSLLASTNPRVAPLDLEGSDFTMGLANRLFLGYSGMAMYLWPAEQLSIHLSLRHAEILLKRLKQRSDYAVLAERAVCASSPDGAASVVTAPFRDSREHTLGLLPFSNILAMSGANEGANFDYDFNSGTMDGNLLFLLLNDMWETHPEVRRVYRLTTNDDAVRSDRSIDWYLFYPAGQATVEDELIQLRRLYFGHGNQESIRALDTANYAFGEGAGGDNGARTEQFTVGFSEAQVNYMLPRVCQALRKTRLGGTNLPDGLEVAGETSFTVPEGQTRVAALRATYEGRRATDLTWWTAGGADESMFRIDMSGALSFAEPENFEAPYDADGDGVYEVRVEVSDGERGGAADLTVRLSDVNEAPTADAGPDQRDVAEGALVTLRGSGTDPDSGDVLSYAWTQTAGDTVVLSDPAASSPTFTAPADLTADTALRFTLRVTDDEGLYAEDSTRVTVEGVTVERQPFSAAATNVPDSHDGSAAFTFELHFSESPQGLSYRTLKYYAFFFAGGVVTDAERKERGKSLRWEITVRPDGNDDVTVALPATTNCNDLGAICAAGGWVLSEGFKIVIPGPPNQQQNAPATGAPAITGTAQVGESLAADTSGISDSDGLTNVSYAYQWLADDVEISNATGSSYELTTAEQGKAIKVQVTFTDDAGNRETLTSTATAAVAAAPEPEPEPTPLTATVHNADTSHDGSAVFTFDLHFSEDPKRPFSYRLLRDDAFTVTGGAVTKARRLERGENLRWEISVTPSGDGPVTVVLPATTDCEADGAICTADGRMLSSRLEITVPGPN